MRPKLLISLIVLLTLLVVPAALADYSFGVGRGFAKPDTNGYVPEYYDAVGTCNDGVLAKTHYQYDSSQWYGPHVMWIVYDTCEMERLGATSAGWERLMKHERAHSRGWQHGEGDPKYNDAYSPQVAVR